jgi:hypothetical protein
MHCGLDMECDCLEACTGLGASLSSCCTGISHRRFSSHLVCTGRGGQGEGGHREERLP